MAHMSFFISPFHLFSILKCLNSHIQSIGSISQDPNHKVNQFITHSSVKASRYYFNINHKYFRSQPFGQTPLLASRIRPKASRNSESFIGFKTKLGFELQDFWLTSSKMIGIISEIKKNHIRKFKMMISVHQAHIITLLSKNRDA